MVLTKEELIGMLEHEVNILLHLSSKIDRAKLDYRPTEKQRSFLELLRYLVVMAPGLTKGIAQGAFDMEGWGAATEAANKMDFDQALAAIETQKKTLAELIGAMPDEDFRTEIDMFGRTNTKGGFLVQTVLNGFAAYRMQLFLYLKACGREELNTMNLWAGIDAPMPS